jgi:hypothetical protein
MGEAGSLNQNDTTYRFGLSFTGRCQTLSKQGMEPVLAEVEPIKTLDGLATG